MVSCMVLIILFYDIAAKLGANAILGVSLAVCKAGAAHKVTNHDIRMQDNYNIFKGQLKTHYFRLA